MIRSSRHAAFLIAPVIAILAFTAPAPAITFDFESEIVTGNYQGALSSLSMTSDGVTATIYRSISTHRFDIVNNTGVPGGWGSNQFSPDGGWFIPHVLPLDWIIVDFSQPITSFSIQYGDYGPSDDDSPIELRAYSGLGGTGSLVGSDSGVWGTSDSFVNFGTVSYAGAAARSVLFQSGGEYEQSLYWDNIQVTVPEPTTLAVAGILALGLALPRRSRAGR